MSNFDVVQVTFDDDNGSRYSGLSVWAIDALVHIDERFTIRKVYHYRAPVGLLKVGDQAIVDSPKGTVVVTVRNVNPVDGWPGLKKWVVCKVDRSLAERREELAGDIDTLNETIQAEVERIIIQRQLELAMQRSPLLRDSVELLGELTLELNGLGGR